MRQNYLITRMNGYGCFGAAVDPRDIVAYRHTLKEAQEEHKIMCIAAGDLQAFDIRGPYEDDTEIEAFHMLRAGMNMLKAHEVDAELQRLGYKVRKGDSFNYFNTGNERKYQALSVYIVEADTGLSFANVDARRDDKYKALQALRYTGFGYHCARIWEL